MTTVGLSGTWSSVSCDCSTAGTSFLASSTTAPSVSGCCKASRVRDRVRGRKAFQEAPAGRRLGAEKARRRTRRSGTLGGLGWVPGRRAWLGRQASAVSRGSRPLVSERGWRETRPPDLWILWWSGQQRPTSEAGYEHHSELLVKHTDLRVQKAHGPRQQASQTRAGPLTVQDELHDGGREFSRLDL